MASGVAANHRPERGLTRDAKKWRDKAVKLEDTFQPGESIEGRGPTIDPRQRNAPKHLMPARYKPTPSDMDRAMALRSRLVNPQGVVPGVGVATFDEKTSDWLMDKAALAEKMRYDQTFAKLFSQADHANRDKFMKLYPEFAQKRIDHIKTIASIQVQLAMMKVTGPQTKDDVDLIIALMNMPNKDNVQAILDQTVVNLDRVAATQNPNNTVRGFFNPFRFMSGQRSNPYAYQDGAAYNATSPAINPGQYPHDLYGPAPLGAIPATGPTIGSLQSLLSQF